MANRNLADTVSRTVKMAMDNGDASSLEEAHEVFRGYRLAVQVGPDIASSPTKQAALLSIVNAGRRAFLGGVDVLGPLDVALLAPWRKFPTLKDAVLDLRGTIGSASDTDPLIVVGDVPESGTRDRFAVRATFDGWAGGVIPLADGLRLPEEREFTPAGVLAGALAVSEAFQHVRGGSAVVGRRTVGMSLWNPGPDVDWMDPASNGPKISGLPSSLWLIGLGHLGQAFLWTLGFLPYERPEDVSLVLHDFDILTEANDSTSPLTFAPVPEKRKTRALAEWCEARGFRTTIVERRFAADFRIAPAEPVVGICGVDNPEARAALEDVGFKRIVEAGLGKGGEEYLSFQIHTFPGEKAARERWGGTNRPPPSPANVGMPAYEALARSGHDECGITTLAGKSVGACFVGMVASTLMVAELLRMVHGQHAYALVDGTLRSLDKRTAVSNAVWSKPFNPGYSAVIE